jgi:hypothetical protein
MNEKNLLRKQSKTPWHAAPLQRQENPAPSALRNQTKKRQNKNSQTIAITEEPFPSGQPLSDGWAT